jgi:hypothetical protein
MRPTDLGENVGIAASAETLGDIPDGAELAARTLLTKGGPASWIAVPKVRPA